LAEPNLEFLRNLHSGPENFSNLGLHFNKELPALKLQPEAKPIWVCYILRSSILLIETQHFSTMTISESANHPSPNKFRLGNSGTPNLNYTKKLLYLDSAVAQEAEIGSRQLLPARRRLGGKLLPDGD
jgi:hypothetical protein